MMSVQLLNYLKPQEIQCIIQENPIICILLGSAEWLAVHLIIGVDSLLSQVICKDICTQTSYIAALPPQLAFTAIAQPKQTIMAHLTPSTTRHSLYCRSTWKMVS